MFTELYSILPFVFLVRFCFNHTISEQKQRMISDLLEKSPYDYHSETWNRCRAMRTVFLFSFPLLSILFSRFLPYSLHLLFLSSVSSFTALFFSSSRFFPSCSSFPLILLLSLFFLSFPYYTLLLSTPFCYFPPLFLPFCSFTLLSAPLGFFSHSYLFSCLLLFSFFFLVFKMYLTLLFIYMCFAVIELISWTSHLQSKWITSLLLSCSFPPCQNENVSVKMEKRKWEEIVLKQQKEAEENVTPDIDENSFCNLATSMGRDQERVKDRLLKNTYSKKSKRVSLSSLSAG